MKIKCGRREFEVTEKDRILDNGTTYQLITQYYQDGWSRLNPRIAKSTFNKLRKEGKIRLAVEKYYNPYGLDFPLYEFVIEQTGENREGDV